MHDVDHTTSTSPADVSMTSGSSGSGNAASGDPVVRVVKVVEPAVVSVTATSARSNPFFGGSSTQQATGSGFIVSSDGVIFTTIT